MEGPERCFSGTVTLPDSISSISELPHSLLPLDTCQSEQGICFTALTQSQGVHVASFGCWPTQSNGDFSIAWYGVPECKNEVGIQMFESLFLKIGLVSGQQIDMSLRNVSL